jgi:hypothetical protein
MSQISSDNNNNNNDNNNDLILIENQENSEQNNNRLNYLSFVSTECSVPTELFNTLSPISLSQITSQSTPFIALNRNDLRREPMGEELNDYQNNQMNTFWIETEEESEKMIEPIVETQTSTQSTQLTNRANDRPPLIGQSLNNWPPISTRVAPMAQISAEEVNDDKDIDALASKVEQLLGRTKRDFVDEDFESLGLIRVIHSNDSNNSTYITTNDVIIEGQRSEPDGKGEPLLTTQQNAQISTNVKKLVHYSSSESEDNELETDVKPNINPLSSTTTQNIIPKKSSNLSDTGVRYRSYSASGGRSGLAQKGLQTGFCISSFLREKVQRKQTLHKESSRTGTQTLRSFLAEQAVQRKQTSNKENSQTGTQTLSSFLNEQAMQRKQTLLKECSQKGTQTLRSFLTEQALQQKNQDLRSQNVTIPKSIKVFKSKKPVKIKQVSKAIQTSQSLLDLESNSQNSKVKEIDIFDNEEKQPISWFIPINSCRKNNKYMNSISGVRRRQYSKDYIKQTSTPLTLQEAFNRNCNYMRTQSEFRIHCINAIADMRKRTAEERLKELTKSYLIQKQNDKLMKTNYTQPVFRTTIRRVFTHQEMRAQTEKIYANLPEVRALREKKKKEEKERSQRLMAQIYKYRLKDNALKGKVSWKITQSCLSY